MSARTPAGRPRPAGGYDISAFCIDLATRAIFCPQGDKSGDWIPGQDRCGIGVGHIGFAKWTRVACAARALCTLAKTAPHEMAFRQAGWSEAIQAARGRHHAPE